MCIWSCPQKAQAPHTSLLPFKVLLCSSALCCLTPVTAAWLSLKCLPIVLHAFSHFHPLSVIPPPHPQLLSLMSPSPAALYISESED